LDVNIWTLPMYYNGMLPNVIQEFCPWRFHSDILFAHNTALPDLILPCSALCISTARQNPERCPSTEMSVCVFNSSSIWIIVCALTAYVIIYLPHCPSVQFSIIYPLSLPLIPYGLTYSSTYLNISSFHPPVHISFHLSIRVFSPPASHLSSSPSVHLEPSTQTTSSFFLWLSSYYDPAFHPPTYLHRTFSCSLCVQTASGVHPASCAIGTGFRGAKARPGRDADHSPPSSTEVVNE
jgi:hypothetical protein